MRIAASPLAVIPGSITTAEILAFILFKEFGDHLPFCRQKRRLGWKSTFAGRTLPWVVAVGQMFAALNALFRLDRLMEDSVTF